MFAKSNLVSIIVCMLLCGSLQAQCTKTNRPGIHVVQHGEYLYRIAKQYNVSIAQLCEWNGITVDAILSDCREIYVAAPTKATSTAPPPKVVETSKSGKPSEEMIPTAYQYIAQGTETVASIAERYGYSEARFRAFNKLGPNEGVSAGRVLRTSDCNCPGPIVTYSSSSEAVQSTNPIGVFEQIDDTDHSVKIVEPEQRVSTTTTSSTDANTTMNFEEMAMVNEVNLLRADPKGYIKYVEEYIRYLNVNGDMGNSINTAYELIEQLKKTPKLSILTPSECIYQAAIKHGEDQKPTGDINHEGTDGLHSWDRVTKSCASMVDGGENLVAGPSDIRRAVMLLLVDDGIENRGHRTTLLRDDWQYVACRKVGLVGTMPNYWIQNFGK